MKKKTKKKKPSRSPASAITRAQHVEEGIIIINALLEIADYATAIEMCHGVLASLPPRSPQRAEVLGYLGDAQLELKNYPAAYETFTEALSLDPDHPPFWYNRGRAGRSCDHIGQSLLDFERAVELGTDEELLKQFKKAVRVSQKEVQGCLRKRGRNFTLEQLIEQEDCVARGLQLAKVGECEEAIQVLQRAIALADLFPQPWNNIGYCFMKLHRYDEAEAAWRRALALDRFNPLARLNLRGLPEIRRRGGLEGVTEMIYNADAKQKFRPLHPSS